MEWKKSYQTFITRRVNDDVADSEDMAKAVYTAAQQFYNFDWGIICDEDKEANNADLEARTGHVLGRYTTPNGDIYINLVFDDPSTGGDYAMIMYCEEY